jgi:hypothetical protein
MFGRAASGRGTGVMRVELGDRTAGHKYDLAYDNGLVVKEP